MKLAVTFFAIAVLALAGCTAKPQERVCDKTEALRLHDILNRELVDNPDRKSSAADPLETMTAEINAFTKMINADLALFKKDYESACRDFREAAALTHINID